MSNCKEPLCKQQALGKHEYCYFHRKQRSGLIPKEDRKYYLYDTDYDQLELDATEAHEKILEFSPYVKVTAKALAKKYDIDAQDVYQHGMACLLGNAHNMNMENDPRQVTNYILRTAYGHMMNFCESQNMFNVRGSDFKSKRKKLPIRVPIEYVPIYANTLNPEEQYIDKEDATGLDIFVAQFLRKRSVNDKYIFYACIFTDEPISYRDVSEHTGMPKSTAHRICRRLKKEWKEYINEQNNC